MASHRGRLQAQGPRTEQSQPWSQEDPLTASDGHKLLRNLEESLSQPERIERRVAFEKARGWIAAAAGNGGVNAPVSKKFWDLKGSRDIRVDIEVRTGLAFVPDED
jgi:hypothetical protein